MPQEMVTLRFTDEQLQAIHKLLYNYTCPSSPAHAVLLQYFALAVEIRDLEETLRSKKRDLENFFPER